MNIIKSFKNATVVGMFLMYVTSMYPWFVWNNLFTFYSCIITVFFGILYFVVNRRDFNQLSIRTLPLLLIAGVAMLWQYRGFSLNGVIVNSLFIVVIFILLHLKSAIIYEILDFITKWLSIGLLISIVAYILVYWLGINIIQPKLIAYMDGRYLSYNYYLFVLPAEASVDYFRFKSIFMEPGHMTMGLVPLIFANKFNLKNKYVLIIFIAELLSFSLAAYVVMFVGYVISNVSLKNVSNLFYGFFFIAVAICVMKITGNYELLQTLIFDRLQFVDGTIAGDNRVMDSYETIYKNTINHSRYLFFGNPNVDSTAFIASGYKKYIVDNGLIGCVLILFTYIFNFICYSKTRSSFAFTLVFILLLYQNAYPFWYCMIISYLIGYVNYRSTNNIIR